MIEVKLIDVEHKTNTVMSVSTPRALRELLDFALEQNLGYEVIQGYELAWVRQTCKNWLETA